jgi:L-2,4-diaminobutyrate decarboxylase
MEAQPTRRQRDAVAVLQDALDIGHDFKTADTIYRRRGTPEQIRDLLVRDLPDAGAPVPDLLDEFRREVLPWCKNEASPRFLGFADTGDDPAALVGELLAMFTQQNLINQGFDSPSATFVDVCVLRWLRDLLGYRNPQVGDVRSVWDVGGVITPGGTASNTVAMMLAREHTMPGTMIHGSRGPSRAVVLVPAGIGASRRPAVPRCQAC